MKRSHAHFSPPIFDIWSENNICETPERDVGLDEDESQLVIQNPVDEGVPQKMDEETLTSQSGPDLSMDVAEMPGPLLASEALDLLNELGELLEELSLRSVSLKRSLSTSSTPSVVPRTLPCPQSELTMPAPPGILR